MGSGPAFRRPLSTACDSHPGPRGSTGGCRPWSCVWAWPTARTGDAILDGFASARVVGIGDQRSSELCKLLLGRVAAKLRYRLGRPRRTLELKTGTHHARELVGEEPIAGDRPRCRRVAAHDHVLAGGERARLMLGGSCCGHGTGVDSCARDVVSKRLRGSRRKRSRRVGRGRARPRGPRETSPVRRRRCSGPASRASARPRRAWADY
jgi:hypothetical protein